MWHAAWRLVRRLSQGWPDRRSGPARSQLIQLVQLLAVATPDLSTLVTAVKAADLVSTLSSPGPFTVFAPTNEAFAALPAGTGLHTKPDGQNN